MLQLFIKNGSHEWRAGQGRSQNLREVPQNFTEVFNIHDVRANDVIQINQFRKEKKALVP